MWVQTPEVTNAGGLHKYEPVYCKTLTLTLTQNALLLCKPHWQVLTIDRHVQY